MTEAALPPVSLIIPNFNGAHLLRANLPAVLAAAEAYPGGGAVIVVDDGSKDASVAVLEAEFPSVRLVRHEDNRGFAEAVHSGVAAAATEWLIFLNSDVRPDRDFIAPLVRHFDRPEVFAVAPLVLDEDAKVNPVSWRGYRIRRGRLKARRWRYDPVRDGRARASLFASGGSMAVRKSLFQALGGFLPIFKPFYSEDFDLGLRAWRRGWRTVFEPASRVVHGRSGSIKENIARDRIRRTRIRNRFLLEWIHVPAGDLAFSLVPGYLARGLGRLLKLDLGYFRGLWDALRRLPEALRLRAEVRRTEVLGWREIMATIDRDFQPPGPEPR
jgi:GT2 family glycosyltransferase